MRKKSLIILAAVLVAFTLSVPVLAADGQSRGFFDTLADIGMFIRNLFVPDGDYFNDQLSSLNDHINSRFAGLGQLYQMINDFFRILSSPPDVSLNLTIPNNFLFPGYRGTRVDIFITARPYIDLIRNVLNASACLFTSITCYHKLRHFFTEEG